MPVLPG
ncbi:hypothetical protein AZE42_00667 [Rhizopogon vesiculosus]|nr:hypothetical protein AZE42_00667 [Rhizopogon vesiculosus]